MNQSQCLDEYKFRCLTHDRPAFFCLNEYCHEHRILCFKCIQEGKHNHQLNIHYYSEMLELLQNRKVKIQIIIEKLHDIKQKAQSLENKLTQKYYLSNEALLLMNNNQLSSFIDNTMKNENEINNLLENLKINSNSISETIESGCEALQLELNSYSWYNLEEQIRNSHQNRIQINQNNFKCNLMPNEINKKNNEQEKQQQNIKLDENANKKIDSGENYLYKIPRLENTQTKKGLFGFLLSCNFKDTFDNDQRQEQIVLQKNCFKYPIALIISNNRVAKTSLLKILFQDIINNYKEFELYSLRIDNCLIYNFVDTTEFDFESNIEEREKQIKLYQQIFYNYPNKVGSLFLVVQYHRIEIMNKNLLSIYKFFRKFSSIISIIVTDMQLSDNLYQSESKLKKQFEHFKFQNIIFLTNNIQREQLMSKLKEKSLNRIQDDYQFDVKDTIFEK